MRDVRLIDENELIDFWGYNPVSFFAPNTSYCSSMEYNHEGLELKTLIKDLHDNGIEVILDVVFTTLLREMNSVRAFLSKALTTTFTIC